MGGGQRGYLQKAELYHLMAEGKLDEMIAMGARALPGLVSVLKSGEAWKKPIAISVLEAIDCPYSIRALKIAAKDEEWGIRALAVNALAKKQGRAAEAAIKGMREDPSGQIAREANVLLLRRKSEPPPKHERTGGNNIKKVLARA